MSKLIGVKQLQDALDELKDFNSKDWRSTMRAAVQTPMRRVMKTAKGNISSISPGKTLMHRTYLGRLVGAGFASRSLRVIVKFSKGGQSVTALLGVKSEAFYALQFFELGTSSIPRKPWLVPAFESSKDQGVQMVSEAFKRRIVAIANKRAKLANATPVPG